MKLSFGYGYIYVKYHFQFSLPEIPTCISSTSIPSKIWTASVGELKLISVPIQFVLDIPNASRGCLFNAPALSEN